MTVVHTLGYPRMGRQRELKFALESYWRETHSEAALTATARQLRHEHWQAQSSLSFVTVGDFSFYDHVLDTSALLGNLPPRARRDASSTAFAAYFRAARGRAPGDPPDAGVAAAEMTKWFDTNYHYLVPELGAHTRFALHPEALLAQITEARQAGHRIKPVILGPITYLWLAKTQDQRHRLEWLPNLLPVYQELLALLAAQGLEWVQIDEPALATELDAQWQEAYRQTYARLPQAGIKLLLTTYFGPLGSNLELVTQLPVAGVHIDAVRAPSDAEYLSINLGREQVLSVGIIDGRNVWRADLQRCLDRLEPLHQRLGSRLWLAPSCSLLHVPYDLEQETELAPELRNWLAFARQKLDELDRLAVALRQGREAVATAIAASVAAGEQRARSPWVCQPEVRQALHQASTSAVERAPFEERRRAQQARWQLPPLPTTTIGSFPQTQHIRRARQLWRSGTWSDAEYQECLRQEIRYCVAQQEALNLDVLVHGEAERNDMVEYFAEHLGGFAVTRHGWVQSFGSRCVKPPILYGDVSHDKPITVPWALYAQSLSAKPVKGMLTGPVTMLNWSFVRDDQPRRDTGLQLALAIGAEVRALEQAGIGIVQIDEPALREGLPLQRTAQAEYLAWAVTAFRTTTRGVATETQIHTHMCYSEFGDIMPAIIALDADVITIETSRSQMDLLTVFDQQQYPNDIGPGLYDIHSPNTPSTEACLDLLRLAAKHIPLERLWVNPDCGLKTRTWAEVRPALANLVAAAHIVRAEQTAGVGAVDQESQGWAVSVASPRSLETQIEPS